MTSEEIVSMTGVPLATPVMTGVTPTQKVHVTMTTAVGVVVQQKTGSKGTYISHRVKAVEIAGAPLVMPVEKTSASLCGGHVTVFMAVEGVGVDRDRVELT